jgi:hypothetical protein
MILHPLRFKWMLTYISSNFKQKGRTVCTGNQFGINMPSAVKLFFSVHVENTVLPGSTYALSFLADNSKLDNGVNNVTFYILIDKDKMKRTAPEKMMRHIDITLAQKMCQFIRYYEIFMRNGGDVSYKTYIRFKRETAKNIMRALSNADKVPIEHSITSEEKLDYLRLATNYFPSEPDSYFFTRTNDYKEIFSHLASYLMY